MEWRNLKDGRQTISFQTNLKDLSVEACFVSMASMHAGDKGGVNITDLDMLF